MKICRRLGFGSIGTLTTALFGSWAGSAYGQSGVSISGNMDVGVIYSNNSNSGSNVGVLNGGLNPTRIIFSGREDLGDGVRAIFRLVKPFNAYTGASPIGFNIAVVGLSDPRLGALTLGRQNEIATDFMYAYAADDTWNKIGASDNAAGTYKMSNAIKYMTPELSGFRFGVTYGLSESSQNRGRAAAGIYTNGPLSVSVGYIQADRPNSTTSSGAITGDFPSTVFNSIAGSSATVDKHHVVMAGASFEINKDFKVLGMTSRVDYDYADATSMTLTNYQGTLAWRASPQVVVRAAYIRTNGTRENVTDSRKKPGWDQLNLGVHYYFSKRTAIYAVAVAQAGRNGEKASIGSIAPSTTSHQRLLTTGIAHEF